MMFDNHRFLFFWFEVKGAAVTFAHPLDPPGVYEIYRILNFQKCNCLILQVEKYLTTNIINGRFLKNESKMKNQEPNNRTYNSF